ncbi:MAG: ribonuclease R [Paraglaciecola sp.]|jgi:ribonuclease R
MTRKKSNKKDSNKFTAKELQREILRLFKRHPKKRMHPKQVAKKLQIDNNKDSVLYALQKLAEDNQLQDWGDQKFQLHRWATSANDRKETIEGRVDMTRTGSAYIVVEGQEQDVHVSGKNLNSALNGDKVLVSTWTPRGRNKPEGEVKKVLERAADHFIGTLYRKRKHAFVVPNKVGMNVDIFVEEDDMNGAQEGEKVVVKVVEWGKRAPRGVVTYVLGESGSSDLEMKSILINNGFYLDFPEMVMAEANELSTEISLKEINRRRDMRDVITFTIDPSDAKDFDDALSLQYLEDGNLEIGVHIADVSHYVMQGTALDKEAYKRSTSVYLVDRVLPMLPEELSNGLCSLRPNEDKCTFSAIFTFDGNNKIIDRWFGRTVTHSDRRFSYEEAQEVIESGEGDFADELKTLNKLHLKLRKNRFRKGSIDFDTEEVRFKLDENAVPIDVYVKERKEAHMLIEEFMLLANREVATYIHKKANGQEIPFVYRIHDEPNPDKVADLARFAKELGHQMHINTPQDIAKSYNRLKEAAKEDKGLALLAPIAIRTMAKAAYSSDNIGHYGLGFQFYSHFTSPIRRYSDVLTHRILASNLEGKILRVPKESLEEQCKHISAMERKAMTAERESIKYKQVEFMENHIGEEFDGRISGIIDRGIFVELVDSKCEGMVGFDTMSESYDVSEGRLQATGKRTGDILKMGDTIRVKVLDADLEKRRIEMALVEA